jgi:hypothetical protein
MGMNKLNDTHHDQPVSAEKVGLSRLAFFFLRLGTTFIPVMMIEKEDLINFHRVVYAIAFGLRAQTDNPITYFGRSADCGLSVGKCAATPKWVR